MQMPSINISFSEVAATAVKSGDRGIIAMILKEDVVPSTNPVIIRTINDIPADGSFSESTKTQIKLALKGYVNTPKKVITYFIDSDAAALAQGYTDALKYFQTENFNYLVIPSVTTDAKTADIVTWIKSERDGGHMVCAVLPNTKADTEGVINFTSTSVTADGVAYTTEQFCSRIAGIIAGTPMTMSATYATLSDATDCTRLTKTEQNTKVAAGEFFAFWDGGQVLLSRAVNSLTTTTATKNEQFQKIKIVDVMDMVKTDIADTARKYYIGKYNNSYSNKQLLVAAIGTYFDNLVRAGVLNSASIAIDVTANRAYLEGKGTDTSAMSDDEIKMANTGSQVFLKSSLSILDAMEDITLEISI